MTFSGIVIEHMYHRWYRQRHPRSLRRILLPTPIHDPSIHHVDRSICLSGEAFVMGYDHECRPALFV